MSPLQKHFAAVYFIVAIALIVVDAVLQIVAQARVPDPGGVVEMVPAVFYAGTRHAERNNALPQSRQLWKLSLELALIAVLISFAIAAVLMLAFSGTEAMSDMDTLFAAPIGVLAGGVIFSFVLSTLIVRILLPMAMRSGLKRRSQ